MIMKRMERMYETFFSIIVAIAGIITIVFSCLRNRVFGRTGNTNDNIGNTVGTVSRGIEDSKTTVNELTDTVKSSTDTSKELEVGIGCAESSIEDAKGTITNIRRLIKARRTAIEENDL